MQNDADQPSNSSSSQSSFLETPNSEALPATTDGAPSLIWVFTLVSAVLLFVLQVALVGAPTPESQAHQHSVGSALFESPVSLVIQPPHVGAERLRETLVDSAYTYRSNVVAQQQGQSAVTQPDSFVGLVSVNLGELYNTPPTSLLPSVLLFAHSPQSYGATGMNPFAQRRGYRWVAVPRTHASSTGNEVGSAMAVGDFDPPSRVIPAGLLSDDVVVGYDDNTHFLVIFNPDRWVYSSAQTNQLREIGLGSSSAPETTTVGISCASGNVGDCLPARVHTITTGQYNSDALLDIALIASIGTQEDPYDVRERLFVCLQIPGKRFSCEARGLIQDGIVGNPGGGGGCNGGAMARGSKGCNEPFNPTRESFQIVPAGSGAAGEFIGVRSVGTFVQVFRFRGAQGGQVLDVRSYDYAQPVQSVSIYNFDHSRDGSVDMVVQLQPLMPTRDDSSGVFDPFSFPYLEVTLGGRDAPFRRVSSGGEYPNLEYPALANSAVVGRRVVPLRSGRTMVTPEIRPEFLVATPLTVANFFPSGNSEFVRNGGVDFAVGGSFVDPLLYDPWSPPNVNNSEYAVGDPLRPMLITGALLSGNPPPPPDLVFGGEFVRSHVEIDNGSTTMRPDFATLTTGIVETGVRLLSMQANRSEMRTLIPNQSPVGNAHISGQVTGQQVRCEEQGSC